MKINTQKNYTQKIYFHDKIYHKLKTQKIYFHDKIYHKIKMQKSISMIKITIKKYAKNLFP
jgi:hypothetical protein